MSSADELRWAASLLPGRRHPETACTPPAVLGILSPAPAISGEKHYGTDGAEDPLKGIRFAPLWGPGPSGGRPEHVREVLLAK